MEARSNAPSGETAGPEGVRSRTRGRLIDRGLDPDEVIGGFEPGAPIDVATFYDILGVMSVSEKAGQGPAYALARLALRAGLSSETGDMLFLAYNQQSAEEAGHGDKVFANAYFAMGGAAPAGEQSVFGDGDDIANALQPTDDPRENMQRLGSTAAVIGGIETVALQRLFPLITALCETWGHPIGQDLAVQIQDVVRPEESRHVLIWRHVFHEVVVPQGSAAIDAYLKATNAGRTQLAGPKLDRDALTRMLGTGAPTARQLLGKERTLVC